MRGGGGAPRLSSARWNELLRELDRRAEALVTDAALWETGKIMYVCEALCDFWHGGVEHRKGQILRLDRFASECQSQYGHVRVVEEVKC